MMRSVGTSWYSQCDGGGAADGYGVQVAILEPQTTRMARSDAVELYCKDQAAAGRSTSGSRRGTRRALRRHGKACSSKRDFDADISRWDVKGRLSACTACV